MQKNQDTEKEDFSDYPPAVAAVMVTYLTGEGVRKSIASALPEVGKIFVVDNGGDEQTRAIVGDLIQQYPGRIALLAHKENNLAAAQNMGIKAALGEDYNWILLLDHDSQPAPGMVHTMLATYRQQPEKEKIGLLAPYVQETGSKQGPRYPQATNQFGFRMARFGNKQLLENIISVVGSGSLIPSRVFPLLGYMDTSLGLDYVDKDFCLRLRANGLGILGVRDAMLMHRLGESCDHKMLGLNIIATNHSAARRYSIYKNRLITMRRYCKLLPAFCLYESAGIIYDILRITLCEKDKREKMKQLFLGLRDGLVAPLAR